MLILCGRLGNVRAFAKRLGGMSVLALETLLLLALVRYTLVGATGIRRGEKSPRRYVCFFIFT
jgi:hypothetical protein